MNVQDWLIMGVAGTVATLVSARFIKPNRNKSPTGSEYITLISLAYAVVGWLSGVGLWFWNVWAR